MVQNRELAGYDPNGSDELVARRWSKLVTP